MHATPGCEILQLRGIVRFVETQPSFRENNDAEIRDNCSLLCVPSIALADDSGAVTGAAGGAVAGAVGPRGEKFQADALLFQASLAL